MARDITILIRAREAVRGAVGRATTALGGLRKMAAGMGGAIASAFRKARIAALALTAAIVAGAAMSVRAFAGQEDAENKLAAALKNVGDNATALMPRLKEFANAMQRQTIYGDEAILSMMAYGKNLGINTNQLEDASKAAIGLAAKYRIDLQTAMMLVGRAALGQTQMLTRYGIVLEETLSPQEKFNELLKIGADNFGLAVQDTDTLTGRLQQLKNAWGDLLEAMGQAVTERLGLKDIIETATSIISDIGAGGTARTQAFRDAGALIKAALLDGADGAVDILKKAAPVIGRLIGTAAKLLLSPESTRLSAVAALESRGEISGREATRLMLPLERRFLASDESKQKLKEEMSRIRRQELGRIGAELGMGGGGRFSAEMEKQAGRRGGGAGAPMDAHVKAMEEWSQKTDAHVQEWMRNGVKAAETRKKKMVDLVKEQAKIEEQIAAKKRSDAEAAHRDELKRINDRMAANKRIAERSIADFIAENRERKKKQETEWDEARKAERLERRAERRGGIGNLGKQSREFLESFRERSEARKQLMRDEVRKQEVASELKQLQTERNATLASMLAELQQTRQEIVTLNQMK